jgi:hypothetical protein
VTTVTPETIGFRVLFSSANSSDRWNLIVQMQEEVVRFLAGRYPEHLPRMRVETPPRPSDPGASVGV